MLIVIIIIIIIIIILLLTSNKPLRFISVYSCKAYKLKIKE